FVRRALVIADDLTGAAEIAGIAHRLGLATRLFRIPPEVFDDGVTVIDTDSRHSLSPENAVRASLANLEPSHFDLIYKKIDSALRGPVLAEVQASMNQLHLETALLLPQNPTRGRTIESGQYLINGVPIDQTDFAR